MNIVLGNIADFVIFSGRLISLPLMMDERPKPLRVTINMRATTDKFATKVEKLNAGIKG